MCGHKAEKWMWFARSYYDLECHGFAFGELGFAEDHVHLQVNVPKRYSIQSAEIMLKSHSAMKMFEAHPGFRKRYPRGAFWSGYEHHESTGFTNLDQSSAYLRDQQRHHSVTIIDDRQNDYPPSEIRQRPRGLAQERRRNGVIGALPLFHYRIVTDNDSDQPLSAP